MAIADDDRQLLEQGRDYSAANAQVGAWRAGAGTVHQKAEELRNIVEGQLASLQPSPDKPADERQVLDKARAGYADLLESALSSLSKLTEAARNIVELPLNEASENPWGAWEARYQGFQDKYNAAVMRSSSHSEKLQQLGALEAKVRQLTDEATRT